MAVPQPKPATTRVFDQNGRIVCQHLAPDGSVDAWLELPSSLKQPLMALVSEVAHGVRETSDYPVPGGDKLVVSRDEAGAIHLRREPLGFPPEGRELSVEPDALSLFIAQVRGV